jgi:hypothetical protein
MRFSPQDFVTDGHGSALHGWGGAILTCLTSSLHALMP